MQMDIKKNSKQLFLFIADMPPNMSMGRGGPPPPQMGGPPVPPMRGPPPGMMRGMIIRSKINQNFSSCVTLKFILFFVSGPPPQF